MRKLRQRQAFTLIEILVVVAIIALLISILLPSLARARAQARMVQCQVNIRTLDTAFLLYTHDNQGRLPGGCYDNNADWLGSDNDDPQHIETTRHYGTSGNRGKQPEWGTIYRKQMMRQKLAYICPDDKSYTPNMASGDSYHSYTANHLLSGAKPETLVSAHYAGKLSEATPNYNRLDHTTKMVALDGVPLITEEDEEVGLNSPTTNEGGWANTDSITNRHFKQGRMGYGNFGYMDNHVGRIQVPEVTANAAGTITPTEPNYLSANAFCVRTAGKKWISGREHFMEPNYPPKRGMYKFIDSAQPASVVGVIH